ncbi:chitin synthase 1-like protein, partial [Leptotrombidium deliense]
MCYNLRRFYLLKQSQTDTSKISRSEAPKGWDVFVVSQNADEDETLNSKWVERVLKLMKLCAYLVTFGVVLCSAILSKITILLMTSIIKPNRTEVSVCNYGIPGLERDKKYSAVFNITDPERVAWIWCLMIVLMVPELMTLFRSARICTFKSYKRPTKFVFAFVTLMETLHTIGIVMLVFVILPSLDVVKGAMLTNCLCVVPSLLSLFSRHSGESKRAFKTFLDFLALAAQISALVVWPLTEKHENKLALYFPLAAVLVSIGWWENYSDKNSPFRIIRGLASMKEQLYKCRYFSYIFVSIWKIIVIFVSTIVARYLVDGNILYMFSQFKAAFSQHKILIVQDKSDLSSLALTDHNVGIEGEWIELDSYTSTPIWFTLIQIVASWLCYVFGKFACRIYIQGFSYAFPLSLTVPITISLLIASCGIHFENSCHFSSWIPRYLFWTCPNEPFVSDTSFFNVQAILWLLWLLSQTWTTIHIWIPKCERLATTEKIFVNPMYSAAIIDQSLALNRRRNDEEAIRSEDINLDSEGLTQDTSQHYETISEHPEDKKSSVHSSDQIIRILACATMWHETHDEMIQMLKSVIRMDEDQCARRNAQKYLRIVDPDYYEFEVNIFFDDAFELCDENDEEMVVNRFVKQLVEVVDEAASNVHLCNIKLKPPKKYPTPYGGRLEWTMPGGNKLIAHLKDKVKIRHRKRWSQVMYMYYLLGHRLMDLPVDVNRKAVIAENTFILTLDGDINFRPHAVQLLVDLMKKNKNLGAACGRIHPVGTGPMVWYQKFEYAVGHWLQKATEHMIGCVLCSPGCFSLFRAKALMDDNVMRRYTTRSDEALHYVQYDQGEDRWLCTLLLQR